MIAFLSPWVLAFLGVLPALWWLLRVMPPKPREVKFPAFFLLKDLKTEIRTAARTPWWLLVLRALMAACFILAFAGPVERMSGGFPGSGGPVTIAVDNGWAAAAHWTRRQEKIKELLPRIGRSGRAVIFLPTAPSDSDGKVRGYGPMDAGEAAKWIDRLAPRPWPADYAAAKEALGVPASYAVFASDGTESAGERDFLKALRGKDGLAVIRDDEVNDPYILKKNPGSFSFEVRGLGAASRPMSLMAFGADGGVLDEYKFSFPAGGKKTTVTWDMPQEMRGKVEHVALKQPAMASAVFLTDSRWRQHPVGIVSDSARKENKSFLNEVYYLRRALEDSGTISIDEPAALMKSKLSAIIWPDSAPVTAEERAALLQWVQDGGFLVRFAGPGLAANPDDPLLPVKLRYGQRAMEGAMTWEKPVKLGNIPPESPLLGLDAPKDVTVTRQLLAEPSPEAFGRTWLQLEDGTPLITGGSVGKGVVVLVHTSAGPDWSNFCYSGLYVEALRRMVSLSAGITDYKARAVLPPLMLMDGFGQLQPPDEKGIAAAVDPSAEFTPSPSTPPGLYGDRREFQVFNLGDHLSEMKALGAVPAGAAEETYALSGERNLKADFFRAALLLLLIESIVTLALRGVFSFAGEAA